MESELIYDAPPEWGLEEISTLITRTRFRFTDERQLQDEMENLFIAHNVPYIREFGLSSTDRIDFLCGHIGVEVKIKSSMPAVQRQLWRYASDLRINALILVTTLTKHRAIAREMQKKPVFVA